MKPRLKIVVAALIALAVGQPALAEGLTGEKLHQLCISKVDAEKYACQFFIYGVYDGLLFGDSTMRAPDKKMVDRAKTHFCPPDRVTVDQMVKVFEDAAAILMQKYPDDMKENVLGILDAAFNHAYPCKQ